MKVFHVPIEIQYLDHYNMSEWGPLKYECVGDAGFDLRAAIKVPIRLDHGPYDGDDASPILVSTGVKVAIPVEYQLEIRSRSGLAAKEGVFVLNSPGTIDSGYRGEINIILALLDYKETHIWIKPGDRIAQAVLMPVYHADLLRVDKLSETERGEGGFGHTGKS